MKLTGTYAPTQWEETPYDMIENRMKATKTSARFAFSGDFEGDARVEYLMFYRSFDPKDSHRAAAQYVGLIRLEGKLRGKTGSFAMTDHGAYESGSAKSVLSVIAGSGTGELAAISGAGQYTADQQGCRWELDVTL